MPASVRVFHTDLGDRAAVERVVREAQPEAVYHLAAQSSPAESLADPWATIGNNLLAQINLFEALLSDGIRPRVLVIGSSDEYGRVRPRKYRLTRMSRCGRPHRTRSARWART